MITKKLSQIATMAGGTLSDESTSERIVRGVSKDTRTIEAGNLYIPIRGQNFDGHTFIEAAIAGGAVASLWERSVPVPDIDFPLILVEDALLAFHRLANEYRKSLPVKVVAITGSNGKTSTKDILNSIVSEKYRVVVNTGNENNEIGVPLTLLSMSEDTEVCITEMGTERFGEIIVLTKMAEPNITMITNVADSHLEELLTRENVAIEKLDIVKGMPEDGIFLYLKDDEVLTKEIERLTPKCKMESFGLNPASDFKITTPHTDERGIEFSLNGLDYEAPIIGFHQIYNATAAITVAYKLGLTVTEIQNGLKKIQFTGMRNELRRFDGFDILDDSYKANPQNTLTALEVLDSMQGYARKIVVLGDMLDLGEKISALHYELGECLDPTKIDYVLTFGDHMKELCRGCRKLFEDDRVLSFDDKEALVLKIRQILIPETLILVKGSRAMHMESIIEDLSK